MTSTRKTVTTSSEGINLGKAFDDHLSLQNLNSAIVTRIVITYDERLRSIAVCPNVHEHSPSEGVANARAYSRCTTRMQLASLEARPAVTRLSWPCGRANSSSR